MGMRAGGLTAGIQSIVVNGVDVDAAPMLMESHAVGMRASDFDSKVCVCV